MAIKDKLILAKAEIVYGEAPIENLIQAERTAHPRTTASGEKIYSFRLDCPNCKCGIAVELRVDGDGLAQGEGDA